MSRIHAARHVRAARQRREDRGWFRHRNDPSPLPRDQSPIVFLRCPHYLRHCGETSRKLAFYGHDGQAMRVTHAFPVRRNALERFLECYRVEDHTCFQPVVPQPGERIYALHWGSVQVFVNGESYQSHVPPTIFRFHQAHAGQVQWREMGRRGGFLQCDCCDHTRWEQDVDVHYQAIFTPQPVAFVRGRPVESLHTVLPL